MEGAIAVDGRLTESSWRQATAAGGFWQRTPTEGATPDAPTEFRVLFDNAALYVGVRAFDSEPKKIRGMLTRRDVESASDWLTVGIDSYHDRRTAFVFAINPAGVQRDFLIFNDSQSDNSWDAVWTAAATIDDEGWSAEFRIPLGQLRFSTEGNGDWGMQIVRVVGRSREESVWSPWPRSTPRVVSHYGTLSGLDGVVAPRRIELLPYTVGALDVRQVADGDPFRGTTQTTGNLGLDFEYGVSNNITLAGTINPDFGQVEADPSEVNLSDNESFFQERRPFFLEGSDIFKFSMDANLDGSETLFYSRRIGARPHDSADGMAEYVSEPRRTTIYGATKLSGKTSSGWFFGLLDAVTAEERATLLDSDGNRGEHTIEPLSNYAVLRLGKDLRAGQTTIDAALTSVHRRLDDTGLDWLHDQAYTTGLGLSHRFAKQRWQLRARMVGSHVRGTAEAIDNTQRASQRYFQRPDADHLDYDPTRTSLSGAGMSWALTKIVGNWRGGGGGEIRTGGLETNDLGFQRGADQALQWLWLQRRRDNPSRHLQRWNINLNSWATSDLGPSLRVIGANVGGSCRFNNFWDAWGGIGLDRVFLNPRALRGGPALRADLTTFFWLGTASDSRKLVQWFANLNGRVTPASRSSFLGLNSELSVQARSNLDIGIGVNVMRNQNADQYVAVGETLTGTGAPTVEQPDWADADYILGRIDQTTVGMTLRVNYTFRPTLSLQLYAQPFVSAGAYRDYKSVTNPRALLHGDRFTMLQPNDLLLTDGNILVDRDHDGSHDYRFPRADFNFRQLRSNAVLRWEYRPGSAVFLVWSHERSGSDDNGQFYLDEELSGLAEERGEHVVMVKATYWYAP